MTTPPNPARSHPIPHAISRARAGKDLTVDEAFEAVAGMIAGAAPDTDIRDLLVALREKGEAATEIAGGARALRLAMTPVAAADPATLVDTCGTGGGPVRTLNISTTAAFVVAGAGVRVAKHGNRSFTSRSGSADVLEALGVRIDISPDHAARTLEDIGLVFLFAPMYHPAMRHVAPVRRELGTATLMNLLGPLSNPAGAARQVVGIADPRRGRAVADALAMLGSESAMVVHAEIGMDEIAPVGVTRVWELTRGVIEEWTIDPVALGVSSATLEGLEGGEPEENAAVIERLLAHPRDAAPALRHAVLLNAAAAIRVGCGLGLREALAAAQASLDDGAALRQLTALRAAGRVSTS